MRYYNFGLRKPHIEPATSVGRVEELLLWPRKAFYNIPADSRLILVVRGMLGRTEDEPFQTRYRSGMIGFGRCNDWWQQWHGTFF